MNTFFKIGGNEEGLWRLFYQMKMGRQWILAMEDIDWKTKRSGCNDGLGEGTRQLVSETSKWIGL